MWSIALFCCVCAVAFAANAPTSATTPTTRPSASPTAVPTGQHYELFAAIGGGGCAESLYYGPQAITTAGSADGLHEYYLSTATRSRNIAHKKWMQIVTQDGQYELFRIYWTFSDPKTLANRFTSAVSVGERVHYLVVTNKGVEYIYDGTWRFSEAAGINTATFARSGCCFSASNGAWGGGPDTIDGNNRFSRNKVFWGQGNFRESDADCKTVYTERDAYTPEGTNPKSYMYYTTDADPTPAPTKAPTLRPTVTAAPTVSPAPSRVPTARPSFTGRPTTAGMELFAVVGGGSCAEDLFYGPQSISTEGSADGHSFYVSTNTQSKAVAHTEWLQVITTGNEAELFRIYWTFDKARTLSEHFTAAVSFGESVSYRVVYASTGEEFAYSGTWRYSGVAQLTSESFRATESVCCFSADDGAWGAGSGTIDGNDANTIETSSFWGLGNFDSSDNPDCSTVYVEGRAMAGVGGNAKSYIYYSTEAATTTSARTTVRFRVTQVLSGFDLSDYASKQTTYENALKKSIADSMYGVSQYDISDLTIASYTASSSASSKLSDGARNLALRTQAGADIGTENVHVLDTIRWIGEVKKVDREVAVDDPSRTISASASQNVHLASVETVQMVCVVEVQDSVYAFNELSQLLKNAVNNGDFDITLHQYATYLDAPVLVGASAVSVETVQLDDDPSGEKSSDGLSSGAIAAIVIVGVGVCIILGGVLANQWAGQSKRVAVSVDSESEFDALEDPPAATAPRAANDAVSTWTVRPIRRNNPRGAPVVPWQVSASTDSEHKQAADADELYGTSENDFGESRDSFGTEMLTRTSNNGISASVRANFASANTGTSRTNPTATTTRGVPDLQIPSAVPAGRSSAPLVSARLVHIQGQGPGTSQGAQVVVAVPATPRQFINGVAVAQAYVQIV